jgi:hypothetical protein
MEKKVSDQLGMPSITPAMGPFSLSNECGMKAVIALLDRLLDPGCYTDQVQFGTFEKLGLQSLTLCNPGWKAWETR